MNTLLDLRGSLPTFIDITHGRSNDVAVLDWMPVEPGSFYVMDRGYLHFEVSSVSTKAVRSTSPVRRRTPNTDVSGRGPWTVKPGCAPTRRFD